MALVVILFYLSSFLDCMAVGWGKSTGWVECAAVILSLGVVLLSSYAKPLPVWDSMNPCQGTGTYKLGLGGLQFFHQARQPVACLSSWPVFGWCEYKHDRIVGI